MYYVHCLTHFGFELIKSCLTKFGSSEDSTCLFFLVKFIGKFVSNCFFKSISEFDSRFFKSIDNFF